MEKININKRNTKKKINKEIFVPVKISLADYFHSGWFVPLLLTFVLCAVFSYRLISSYDIGFHLSAGRWIIENLSFPSKDIFTYTVNQNDYIDLQWMFQIICYTSYKIFSYEGLTFMNVFLILILFFLIMKRLMYYGVPVSLAVFSLLFTLIAIQVRISNRPEVFTWIGILITLLVLDNYYNYRKKYLYLLPFIMFFWVNLHGLFIIGLFIIFSYLISILKENSKFDLYLFKWFIISSAVTFINPYFFNGVLFPVYLFTRLQASNVFNNSISELASPLSLITELPLEIYLYIISSFISIVIIFFTYKKRKLHEFILLAAFFYISFSTYRNIPFFIIYSAYIITVSSYDLFLQYGSSGKIGFRVWQRIFPAVLSVLIILTSLRIMTNSYYSDYNGSITFGSGIDDNAQPEKLSDYLIQNKSGVKMINQLDLGGWLHWNTDFPVFIDGRLEVMREDFFSEYNKSFKVNGLNYLIQKYKPNKIIYNHSTAYFWTDELNKLKEWKPEYVDGNFIIYANDSSHNKNISELLKEIMLKNNFDTLFSEKDVTEMLELKPISKIYKFMKGFYKSQKYFPEMVSLGNFAMQNNNLSQAEIFYLNYLIKTKEIHNDNYHKDVFMNLASINVSKNNYRHALLCYESLLLLDPGNETAKIKEAEIRKLLK